MSSSSGSSSSFWPSETSKPISLPLAVRPALSTYSDFSRARSAISLYIYAIHPAISLRFETSHLSLARARSLSLTHTHTRSRSRSRSLSLSRSLALSLSRSLALSPSLPLSPHNSPFLPAFSLLRPLSCTQNAFSFDRMCSLSIECVFFR